MSNKQRKIHENLKKVDKWMQHGIEVVSFELSDRTYARRLIKRTTKTKDGKIYPINIYGGNLLIGINK